MPPLGKLPQAKFREGENYFFLVGGDTLRNVIYVGNFVSGKIAPSFFAVFLVGNLVGNLAIFGIKRKKLFGLIAVILFISTTSFAQQFALGTITKRDTSAYSKPVGYRVGFHTDNFLYSWDKVRYKRVANENYKVWTGCKYCCFI